MKYLKIVVFLAFAFAVSSLKGQSQISAKKLKRKNYQEVTTLQDKVNDSIVFNQYPMYPDGSLGVQYHIKKFLNNSKKLLKEILWEGFN